MPPKLFAVINVGSTFLRLVIAEFPEGKDMHVVEQAVKFLGLGREVYTVGVIRKKTISQAIQIFLQYKELLTAYGITPEATRVIGTAALREARNRDTFIDRVEVRTGFRLQVLDGIEENRLSYMAVQYALKDQWSALSKHNSMIAEVGGGSTELILLRRGMICAVHSLSFGTVRLEEAYRGSQLEEITPQTLRQSMNTTKELLDDEMKLSTVKSFIAVGNYARLAAEIAEAAEGERYWRINKTQWLQLTHLIHRLSPEEIVRRYGIPASAVEGFGSALLAFFYLLEDTAADEVFIPKVGYSEGLLVELGPGIDDEIQSRFLQQVRASALSLGKKYHFDADHAKHVAELSLEIFDQMKRDHNLDPRSRLLLEVAAILHDIGTYIKPSGHHKHGQYLVENSEIFGLNPSDIGIIGNVVRYHRKSPPMTSHVNYTSLPREDRLAVLKLAAILRVADALDRGHSQKIRNLRLERRDEELHLKADYTTDVASERFSLSDKCGMFEDVFGYKVILT
jgi:exopolyphosphatase/guanosine-5'-triphosphate,3'-diphosphate pyrophosphatase